MAATEIGRGRVGKRTNSDQMPWIPASSIKAGRARALRLGHVLTRYRDKRAIMTIKDEETQTSVRGKNDRDGNRFLINDKIFHDEIETSRLDGVKTIETPSLVEIRISTV